MHDWVNQYWDAIACQDAQALRAYFSSDAVVRWHCTNEQFTTEGFIRANCDYPGSWSGAVERVEPIPGGLCTAAHVWSDELSCHAVSFFHLNEDGLIVSLDEYWGDDGAAPEWRQKMALSHPISKG